VTDEELRWLYEKEGFGANALAFEFGVHQATVYNRLKKANTHFRPLGTNSSTFNKPPQGAWTVLKYKNCGRKRTNPARDLARQQARNRYWRNHDQALAKSRAYKQTIRTRQEIAKEAEE